MWIRISSSWISLSQTRVHLHWVFLLSPGTAVFLKSPFTICWIFSLPVLGWRSCFLLPYPCLSRSLPHCGPTTHRLSEKVCGKSIFWDPACHNFSLSSGWKKVRQETIFCASYSPRILKALFNNLLASGFPEMAQWLRIHLPMQGTRVQALVREDPTCRGATKPVHHNYWACALEPASRNYWSLRAATTEACAPRARAPQQEATAMRSPRTATKSSPCSPQLEKARVQQRRPNSAKNK